MDRLIGKTVGTLIILALALCVSAFASESRLPSDGIAEDQSDRPYNEMTIYPDGTGDVPTIQEAIDIIIPGGIIYLGDGVFSGFGNYGLVFDGKELTLRSLSLVAEACVIDCGSPPSPGANDSGYNHDAPPPYHIDRDRPPTPRGFTFDSGEGPNTIIRGITVINGFTNKGGGVFISGSSPTIEDCIFQNNHAPWEGGGAYIEYSSAHFARCVFSNNQAGWGGGLSVYGLGSSPFIEDCIITDNSATEVGGGIDIHNQASPIVTFCQIQGNEANWGGGLAVEQSSYLELRYCTITENSANEGGGIYANNSFQCWFNIISYSSEGGAFMYTMPDSRELPNIACCNFSGNAEGDWEDEIAPLLNNDGNFSEDPQYCGSIGTGNISLQSDSPCLAAHNDCAQQIGAMPMGCGSSASLVSSWSQVKALY